METVPDGKERQRHHLAVELRAEEFHAFVDVLGAPVIRVDVERQDVVIELGGVLESPEIHVGTAIPLVAAVFVLAVVRQAKDYANLRIRARLMDEQVRFTEEFDGRDVLLQRGANS